MIPEQEVITGGDGQPGSQTGEGVLNMTNGNFTKLWTLFPPNLVSITGAITLDATAFGKLFLCTGTSANYIVDLPTAVGNEGKSIGFKFSASLTKLVTLDGSGTETIELSLTKIFWSGEYVVLISNGTNWEILDYRKKAIIARAFVNSQSIPDNTADTKVTINTSVIDNTGLAVDVASYNLNFLRPGNYRITVDFKPLTTVVQTYALATVRANGSTILGSMQGSNPLTGAQQQTLGSFDFVVTTQNYIDVVFYQFSGGGARTYRVYLQYEEIL